MEHTRIVETALAEFDSRKKLGGEEFSLKYREQLLQEIEESFVHYKSHNDSKNIFKAANTPITLCVMWAILYIFAQISSLVMLYPLANFANLLMWTIFLLMMTWAYAKYRCSSALNMANPNIDFYQFSSGEFSQIGVTIELLILKLCFPLTALRISML